MRMMLSASLDEIIAVAARHLAIDKSLTKSIRQRLKQAKLIRDENPEDHFCVFIVPFDKESKRIYLGHHKKANDWIPPGGHIEKNETPVEATIREAREELNVIVDISQLELFAIDYLDVSAPHKTCKLHWHLWYLWNTKPKDFEFDKSEFYDAGWYSIEKALRKVRIPQYQKAVKMASRW